jgi:hypothetical protein
LQLDGVLIAALRIDLHFRQMPLEVVHYFLVPLVNLGESEAFAGSFTRFPEDQIDIFPGNVGVPKCARRFSGFDFQQVIDCGLGLALELSVNRPMWT